jgi:N-methylhydantoinase A
MSAGHPGAARLSAARLSTARPGGGDPRTAYRISVDCGGTFTDGILLSDAHQVWVAKADSTPSDPKAGVVECISRLAAQVALPLPELLGATKTIVLGTTLATNIVATRTGAVTGAIATKGFRDRLSFLHVAKSDLGGDRKATAAELFSFRSEYPRPLAPRHLVAEVEERLNFKGEVLIPLRDEDVRQAVGYLKRKGVEAIAVNLLFSHLNPMHELRVERVIKEEFPQAYVALSSRVLPTVGEVGRWSTTMFSAYVAPKTTEFVRGISELLAADGFAGALAFMQSNGGVATGEVVCENPAALLVSGPAAGPALGVGLGRARGLIDIVTVDMGGTSFDISIIPDGQVNVTQKKIIDGKKYALPTVDVNAIGAGGGSIASIDLSGRLQVGPASAGAVPGPACYGLGGTEPTVTDANLVLGYLNPGYFLGGDRPLRKELAEAAVKAKVGDPLGLSVVEAAAAIHDVVNAKMAGAVDIMFSQRGCDPRDFTLIAAGGAAPVHVARLTREIGMKHFISPRVAPVFCAFGMMYADLKHNYTRPYTAQAESADLHRINELFAEMEAEARRTLEREGAGPADITIERSMDIHYYGQVREQNAAVPDGRVTAESLAVTIDRFHDKHRRVIGYSEPGYPTVIVRLHLAGIARIVPPPPREIPPGRGDLAAALKERRPAYFREAGGFTDVPIYDGEKFGAGDVISGPCIVEERMTTLVLPPGETVTIDSDGSYATVGASSHEPLRSEGGATW